MLDVFKHSVIKFLENHKTAVLATVDANGQPATSVIFYTVHDRKTLRFITKSETLKAENIANTGAVAMTVLDRQQPTAVNLTGTLRSLKGDRDHDSVLQEIMIIARDELGDHAPIIKLRKGYFVAYELKPEKAILSDYSAKGSTPIIEKHNY